MCKNIKKCLSNRSWSTIYRKEIQTFLGVDFNALIKLVKHLLKGLNRL